LSKLGFTKNTPATLILTEDGICTGRGVWLPTKEWIFVKSSPCVTNKLLAMGKTTELLSLLKTGNSDAARRLIAKFKKGGKKKALAKELNVPDDNGQTVIHFCASQNFVEFLQDLAELGASIDLADNKG
jgi:hypothetical protein